MEDKRKLARSMSDKAILGVCSGFARYFDIDPIIVRLVVVLLALFGTIGVWFYILAAIIMPKDTDFAYSEPRYDSQTGRPIYEAGGTVYENRASDCVRETPVQDAEFRTEPFTASEGCSYENAGSQDAAEGPETVCGTGAEAGESSGSWTEPPREEAPKSDPSRNTQGYQTDSGRNYQTYQAQPQPQAEHHVPRRNRNTGILLIIIGVVILAKILLPKVNIWIPIAIASIFFGIYLCCRKK